MRVTVDVDKKMIREVEKRLGEMSHKAPNVISNALNRALTNVSTNISKEVRKEYVIKAGDVKETLKKQKSTKSTLSASVRSVGGPVPLDRFRVSPRTVQPKRKKPIKIAVKKDGLKETLGAFIADISGIKVFKRQTKRRLPIKRLFGPSVPQMVNEEVSERINEEGRAMFLRRLDHEVNRILSSGSGKL